MGQNLILWIWPLNTVGTGNGIEIQLEPEMEPEYKWKWNRNTIVTGNGIGIQLEPEWNQNGTHRANVGA